MCIEDSRPNNGDRSLLLGDMGPVILDPHNRTEQSADDVIKIFLKETKLTHLFFHTNYCYYFSGKNCIDVMVSLCAFEWTSIGLGIVGISDKAWEPGLRM